MSMKEQLPLDYLIKRLTDLRKTIGGDAMVIVRDPEGFYSEDKSAGIVLVAQFPESMRWRVYLDA